MPSKYNSVNELEFEEQREEQKEMEFGGEGDGDGFEMVHQSWESKKLDERTKSRKTYIGNAFSIFRGRSKKAKPSSGSFRAER